MSFAEIAAMIAVILMIVNIAWTIIVRKYKLPASVIKYKKLLDTYGVQMIVLFTEAEALKTDEAKRKYVQKKLKDLGATNGVDIPDSVLNILIEFAYTKYKQIAT
jgi:hypothetical protein